MVQCDKGFSINGSAELECLENGNWSSSASCHLVTCPGISTVHLTLPKSDYEKIATIQCPPGLVLLSGDQQVEVKWQCGEKGQWTSLTEAPVDPHILKCVPKRLATCLIPVAPEFGAIVPDTQHSGDVFEEGYHMSIKCKQGYELHGNNFTVCMANGSWDNNSVCKEALSCGEPPSLPLVLPVSVYENIQKLHCQEGYQSYGDMTLRCQPNKKWSRFRGRCLRITCGKPMNLAEGMAVSGNSYLYQGELKVNCDSEYTLVGDSIIQCEKNGKWSELPKCVKTSTMGV